MHEIRDHRRRRAAELAGARSGYCLAILGGGLVEIFGFGLGENSQNFNQVARCTAGCLCGSALHTLAKSVSEFQENPFVAGIAELRLRPCPDGSFRFENAVFHLLLPDRQRLVFFAEHALKKGFDQWVLHRKPRTFACRNVGDVPVTDGTVWSRPYLSFFALRTVSDYLNRHRSSASPNLLANDSGLFSFRFCAVHPKDAGD
jgi:hypothetical protein